MTEIKRNRGRFVKGQSGNPSGRKKRKDSPVPSSQEIRNAFYKAFVAIFAKGGDPKELIAFCKKNQTNMKLLVTEIRKLLPEIDDGRLPGEEKVVVKIIRTVTDDIKRIPVTMRGDQKEIGHAPPKETTKPEPEAMTDEQLRKGIDELEKKKADILTALAEKRPNKSKTVN